MSASIPHLLSATSADCFGIKIHSTHREECHVIDVSVLLSKHDMFIQATCASNNYKRLALALIWSVKKWIAGRGIGCCTSNVSKVASMQDRDERQFESIVENRPYFVDLHTFYWILN